MPKCEIGPKPEPKRKPRTDWARLITRMSEYAIANYLKVIDWRYGSIMSSESWRSLNSHDWSFILVKFPEFTNRCPWNKLHRNHPRIWAELVKARPELADRCPWEMLDDYDYYGFDLCRNENWAYKDDWAYKDELFIKISGKDRSRIAKRERYKCQSQTYKSKKTKLTGLA